jgi:hypothetical protein
MATTEYANLARSEQISEIQYEAWKQWPVNWTAVWIGALTAVAIVVLFGLVGVALGSHLVNTDLRVADLKTVKIGALAAGVFAAFLAFVAGGWVAGKIAGILHAEPAMLHGAIVWLLALPMLIALTAVGSASLTGGWYAGLISTHAVDVSKLISQNQAAAPTAAETTSRPVPGEGRFQGLEEQAAKANRNSALGAITALLLGLMGSVLGGWMASGEPMHPGYRRAVTQNRM